jgi:hypothetical protein
LPAAEAVVVTDQTVTPQTEVAAVVPADLEKVELTMTLIQFHL